MKKCEKCGREYAEDVEHICAAPPAAKEKHNCPECGAEFEGQAISKASPKLEKLSTELAEAKRELAAEKAKAAAPPARQDPPAAPPAPKRKAARRRMIYGASKRAA